MSAHHENEGRLAGQVALVAGEGALPAGVAARLRDEAAVVVTSPLPVSAAAARDAVEAVRAAHGRLDILVCSAEPEAAVRPLVTLETVRAPVAGRVLWLMQAAHAALRQRGGRIVNLLDAPSDSLFRGRADAEIELAALATLTRSAAEEWGVDGVLVNALAVAADTPAFQALRQRDPAAVDTLLGGTPMRRMGDIRTDVGGAVMLLLSESGSFLTGHVLRVDGGQHLTPSPWEVSVPAVDAAAWQELS